MIDNMATPTTLPSALAQAQDRLAEQLRYADQSTIEDMCKYLQAAEHYAAIVASLTAAINCPKPQPVPAAVVHRHTARCTKWAARARDAEKRLAEIAGQA